MAKHRGTVYAVIRERRAGSEDYDWDGYAFSAITGVYATLQKAEEMAAVGTQALLDAAVNEYDFRFSVKPTAYYDE